MAWPRLSDPVEGRPSWMRALARYDPELGVPF
jgi:hypothetical protein